MSQPASTTSPEEQRIAVRDLLADTIDTYMMQGGEYREYDLADRIQKTLHERGWWVVWGATVAHMADALCQIDMVTWTAPEPLAPGEVLPGIPFDTYFVVDDSERCTVEHHVYEPPQDGRCNHYDLRCMLAEGHEGNHSDVFESEWQRA
jgi:hypothetical protein